MTTRKESEKTMSLSSGKQWPLGITISTLLIVAACALTIYVALLQPVEEDTDLMLDYHSLDANVNDVIVAEIAFNKKYKVQYIGEGVSEKGSRIAYRVEDLDGKPVNDAKIEVVLTRPITKEKNVNLDQPRVENGNYYFDNTIVSEKGRWNILAKVSVGELYRHMNLKSDTTNPNVFEYGLNKPMRNYVANGARTY